MNRTNPRYFLILLPFQALLSACDPQNECDAHPETCPGLDIKITSSTLVKKLSPGTLDFSVAFHDPGKPENPADVKAAIVSTTDIPCRQALTTDPKPKVDLTLPKPNQLPDGTLIYSVQPTSAQLASLPLGQGKLCVYGRDIGSADVFVINKSVKIAGASSITEGFVANGYMTPQPKSISISKNKRIYLLFSYDTGANIVRDMRAYTYSPLVGTTPQYGISIMGGRAIFDPTFAAASAQKTLLLRPNGTMPSRFELYLCDPVQNKPCTTDATNQANNWNIMDSLTTLAADRNSGAFFIATKSTSDGIRGYDSGALATSDTLASKALWTADKPTNTTSDRTILALGDLAGTQLVKPPGQPQVVVVESASHSVSVLMQPAMPSPSGAPPKLSRDTRYSDGLQAKLTQVLTSSGGTDLSALAVGDLDGDGLADVVMGFNQQLRVLFNMGNGTFRLAGDYPMNKGEENSLMIQMTDQIVDIAIGDIDNAPGAELVVLTGTADATISVYPVSAM